MKIHYFNIKFGVRLERKRDLAYWKKVIGRQVQGLMSDFNTEVIESIEIGGPK